MRDSTRRKSTKHRGYVVSHSHRTIHRVPAPQVKETSELWGIRGDRADFSRVRPVHSTTNLHSTLTTVAARTLERGGMRTAVGKGAEADVWMGKSSPVRDDGVTRNPVQQETRPAAHPRGPPGPVL